MSMRICILNFKFVIKFLKKKYLAELSTWLENYLDFK